ncbi:MAG: hypothetical protein AAF804_16340 [Bacteroidota bacterium]
MAISVLHVAFPLSEETRVRTLNLIALIDNSDDAREHVEELTDVIIQMTEEGLKYLFLDSLRAAKVSKFQIKAVQMGVQAARKGLEVVGRRALKSMGDEQLRGIARYMEGLLLEVEEN